MKMSGDEEAAVGERLAKSKLAVYARRSSKRMSVAQRVTHSLSRSLRVADRVAAAARRTSCWRTRGKVVTFPASSGMQRSAAP